MDSYGRVFYIDHKNHTTTWQKPKGEHDILTADSTNSILNTNENPNRGKHQQERQQLDKRYQCIRKSIAKNSNIFMQEPSSNEINPPVITADRQRQHLVNVSLDHALMQALFIAILFPKKIISLQGHF